MLKTTDMDNNNKKIVADQVVDMMAASGIKHLYAITGDSLNALTNAIDADGRIKFIHVRNEEAAAFAAGAEAQLTGHLAACAGSSGPGHVHLINGLYDATRSDAPVLAIASTCASNMFGTGYFQETDPTLLFSNCTVYNQTASNAQQVPHMLQGAMQHAVSEGGVGVMGLPADVATMQAADAAVAQNALVTSRLPEATDEDIEKAVALISGAKKVAIYAGLGAAGAKNALLQLAEKLKAPVVTSYKSQMELAGDNPYYVGHLGYLGMWSAIDAIGGADVVIIVGTNFPYPGFFPASAKTIQVDVRAERIGKRARVDVGIRADAADFLEKLLPKVSAATDSSYLDTALAAYKTIQEKLALPVANKGSKGNVRPEYFFSLLDQKAADDAIFTVDTGMNNLWTSHYLTQRGKRSMIGSFTHGSMANALPQSIGAAVAFPERQVIAVCGDGGLAMLMGELLTIAQYNLPVKIFVADNRSLAFVRWEMELAGYTPVETNLKNPDFADVAKAIGIQAESVDDPANLESAVDRWLSAKGPALLSVVTETEAASFAFSQKLMESAKPESGLENYLAPGTV